MRILFYIFIICLISSCSKNELINPNRNTNFSFIGKYDVDSISYKYDPTHIFENHSYYVHIDSFQISFYRTNSLGISTYSYNIKNDTLKLLGISGCSSYWIISRNNQHLKMYHFNDECEIISKYYCTKR